MDQGILAREREPRIQSSAIPRRADEQVRIRRPADDDLAQAVQIRLIYEAGGVRCMATEQHGAGRGHERDRIVGRIIMPDGRRDPDKATTRAILHTHPLAIHADPVPKIGGVGTKCSIERTRRVRRCDDERTLAKDAVRTHRQRTADIDLTRDARVRVDREAAELSATGLKRSGVEPGDLEDGEGIVVLIRRIHIAAVYKDA